MTDPETPELPPIEPVPEDVPPPVFIGSEEEDE